MKEEQLLCFPDTDRFADHGVFDGSPVASNYLSLSKFFKFIKKITLEAKLSG